MDPRLTVTGNVGASVNVRVTPRGKTIAEFTMASNHRVLNDGQWTDGATTWLNVRCLGSLATHVGESLKKGDPVVVAGRLEDATWLNADKEPRSKTWVIADSVGHDLTRGKSTFERVWRNPESGDASSDAWADREPDEPPA